MRQAHHPGAAVAEWGAVAELCSGVAALAAASVYLLSARRLRHRGDTWPRARDVAFASGCGAMGWAMLTETPGGPFTGHMAQHLIVGMVAPLLLVLARPLTLALRLLPPGRVRRGLLRAAHARPVAVLLSPPVAALVDVGGLWLLYRTGLLAATHQHPVLQVVTHLHVLAAGLIFTFSVCQLDPVRRRWSLAARGTAVLTVGATHSVLAKGLYGSPPPGTSFATHDLRTGAQLMYYGGDLVEVALAVALAVQWYGARGRAHARRSAPEMWRGPRVGHGREVRGVMSHPPASRGTQRP
ncbi:cytochrome c oxidase assembly protein [Streptomyces bobili]|uniref:cytochrome c oxidase assembly protein n=1 Tax=Streptomyces bobili TaxID=67280 RepID=UPI001FCA10D6|nr:cytochrome c oxidase assembly protein [Streptomyces bobili]